MSIFEVKCSLNWDANELALTILYKMLLGSILHAQTCKKREHSLLIMRNCTLRRDLFSMLAEALPTFSVKNMVPVLKMHVVKERRFVHHLRLSAVL